ncbi:MAG: hypothetical protein H0X64_10685 [Gemmatimonadaceae bacterium]|nr:hypothetical protein [Gemmatimonadaceae bacterium]
MLPADLKAIVSPKVAACLDYASTLVGVTEVPLGSNRAPDIDAWCREFGSPLGSYWCALYVGHVRKTHGLWVPSRDVGNCDEWVLQARERGLASSTPVPGAAAVFTNWSRHTSGRYKGQHDAVHISLVLRVTPRLEDLGGNTTLTGFSRNGDTVAKKGIDRNRILCWVLPGDTPAAAA